MNSSMYSSSSSSSRQRQQQQQRSHSISGQELSFNALSGYQRLNQFITQHVSPELDHHRQSNYATMQTPIYQSSQLQQQQQQQHLRTNQGLAAGRSPSPLSYAGHIEQNAKYQNFDNNSIQKPRNQLHASLECLNSSYIEYQHQHQQQQHQFSRQHQLHQQMSPQNHHYASTTSQYMLATPPANTVVNQSGDQDLAAAAMDNMNHHHHHHNQYQPANNSNNNNNNNSTGNNNIYAHQQSIVSRAMAQVNQQSPLRRFSSAQHGATTTTNLLANLQLQHPMRAGHSSLSLASPSSSYIIEDKLQNEIKKLHSELKSEREKNEALTSQLNINSNLMAAFEQSLTTLNSRLRQLTTINDRKDQEIDELRMQLEMSKLKVVEQTATTTDQPPSRINSSCSPANSDSHLLSSSSPAEAEDTRNKTPSGDRDGGSGAQQDDLTKLVEDLRRQLIEKDRLLTDTRLEALSAAHQLEQLESRLDKSRRHEHQQQQQQQSIEVNEELDELLAVQSPSDSDGAVTDSAHFSEINSSQIGAQSASYAELKSAAAVRLTLENSGDTHLARAKKEACPEGSAECNIGGSNHHQHQHQNTMDNHSNHSSDYHDRSSASEVRTMNEQQLMNNNLSESDSQQFHSPANDSASPMDRLVDSLLSSAS